jgi:hypothetical protein
MQLLVIKFSPPSFYFLSFRSRRRPQHPVLKHSNTTKSEMDGAFADPENMCPVEMLELYSLAHLSFRSLHNTSDVLPHIFKTVFYIP